MTTARVLALLAGGVLAGLPLAVLPVRPVFWLAGLTELLCAVGALARSTVLAAAGATVALLAYAGALWIAGGPPDPAGALAFGTALLVALEATDLAGRFHGAAVAPAVVRRQLLCWGAIGAAGIGTAALADTMGALLVFTAPAWIAPALAAAGALGVVIGLLGLVGGGDPAPPAR